MLKKESQKKRDRTVSGTNFFAVPPEKLSWTSLTVAASPKDPLNVEIHKTDQFDNHREPSTNPISPSFCAYHKYPLRPFPRPRRSTVAVADESERH